MWLRSLLCCLFLLLSFSTLVGCATAGKIFDTIGITTPHQETERVKIVHPDGTVTYEDVPLVDKDGEPIITRTPGPLLTLGGAINPLVTTIGGSLVTAFLGKKAINSRRKKSVIEKLVEFIESLPDEFKQKALEEMREKFPAHTNEGKWVRKMINAIKDPNAKGYIVAGGELIVNGFKKVFK